MKPAVLAASVLAAAALLLGASGPVGAATSPPPSAAASARTAPQGEELSFERLEGSGGTFVSPRGELQDVEMTAEDVALSGSEVTMGQVVLEGVVPFAAVAQEVGPRTRLERAENGEVRVIRTVSVLGRGVDVSGTGGVQAVDGRVVVEPTAVEVAGPRWFQEMLARGAARLVTVEHDVPGLPRGLSLQDVDVVEGGFAVRLTGQDVTFGS